MLKEILNFVLFGLSGWLSFLLAAAVWAREKRENKRSDGAGDENKPGGNRA